MFNRKKITIIIISGKQEIAERNVIYSAESIMRANKCKEGERLLAVNFEKWFLYSEAWMIADLSCPIIWFYIHVSMNERNWNSWRRRRSGDEMCLPMSKDQTCYRFALMCHDSVMEIREFFGKIIDTHERERGWHKNHESTCYDWIIDEKNCKYLAITEAIESKYFSRGNSFDFFHYVGSRSIIIIY